MEFDLLKTYKKYGFNDNPLFENPFDPQNEQDKELLENLRTTVLNWSSICFNKCVKDFEGDLTKSEKMCVESCVTNRIHTFEDFFMEKKNNVNIWK